MRRLLLVPVVVCPVAAAAVLCSPYLYPILTTARSVFRRCPPTANTEADPI